MVGLKLDQRRTAASDLNLHRFQPLTGNLNYTHKPLVTFINLTWESARIPHKVLRIFGHWIQVSLVSPSLVP